MAERGRESLERVLKPEGKVVLKEWRWYVGWEGWEGCCWEGGVVSGWVCWGGGGSGRRMRKSVSM